MRAYTGGNGHVCNNGSTAAAGCARSASRGAVVDGQVFVGGVFFGLVTVLSTRLPHNQVRSYSYDTYQVSYNDSVSPDVMLTGERQTQIRALRKKREQKRLTNRHVYWDGLSQASADNIQTPFSRRCPPTINRGNLLRDGFGFKSIISGAAPNSAVVADHDCQLEQIVRDSCLLRAKHGVDHREHVFHHHRLLARNP